MSPGPPGTRSDPGRRRSRGRLPSARRPDTDASAASFERRRSALCIAALKAFSTSGRLSVIVSTAPSRLVSTSAIRRSLTRIASFELDADDSSPIRRADDRGARRLLARGDFASPSALLPRSRASGSRGASGAAEADGGGSAVVITPDGFLLTSAHVVARTRRLRPRDLRRRHASTSSASSAPIHSPISRCCASTRTGSRRPSSATRSGSASASSSSRSAARSASAAA